jgi:HSP20 family molecular chaperone IbpA
MYRTLTYTTNSSRNFNLKNYSTPSITNDGAEVIVALAGFAKNNVNITYTESESSFKIEAKKGSDKYEQVYDVCDSFDLAKATAVMQDGELKIKIPYKQSTKPRTIKIE